MPRPQVRPHSDEGLLRACRDLQEHEVSDSRAWSTINIWTVSPRCDAKDQERLDKQQARMVEAYKVVKKGDGKDEKGPVEDRLKYLEASAEVGRIRQSWPDIPMIYAVHDSTPANARVMVKGDPKTLGPEVPRGFLQILGGQTVPADYKGSGRELLAQWITDPKNPLTARVMVNRVWLWHFGRGLVNTPNDFGKRGRSPTHPELLDYLTSRFIDGGWSLKKLHKDIILTRAYATASGHDEANAVKDAKNEFYWRFDRRRLTAEELRDSMLAGERPARSDTGRRASLSASRRSYVFTQHNPFVGGCGEVRAQQAKRLSRCSSGSARIRIWICSMERMRTAPPRRASATTTAIQALYHDERRVRRDAGGGVGCPGQHRGRDCGGDG